MLNKFNLSQTAEGGGGGEFEESERAERRHTQITKEGFECALWGGGREIDGVGMR